MKKRLIFLILLALALFTAAEAEGIHLPASLKSIGAEAFMGDESIMEVTLPEGVEYIGPRAFKDCPWLWRIVVPQSVTEIGEEAFDAHTDVYCWEGSPAIARAEEAGSRLVIMHTPAAHEAAVKDDALWVTVSTAVECWLSVSLFSPEGDELPDTQMIPCGAGLDHEEIMAYCSLPSAFWARIELQDEYGNPLCEPLVTGVFDRYADFNGKTPESFSAGTVLDFGAAGFGVLREEVRTAKGVSDGGVYTVSSDEPVSDGDLLYLPGENQVLRAQNVSQNADGTYTLTADESAGIADFYQYLNLHSALDAVSALEGSGSAYEGEIVRSRATVDLVRYTIPIPLGPVTVTTSTGISVTFNFHYDASLFGRDYVESEIYVTLQGSLGVKVKQEADLVDLSLPLFAFSVPTAAPGVLLDLDLKLPFSVTASMEAEASVGYTAKFGMKYDSRNGASPIHSFEPEWTASTKGEISCSVGPQVSVGVSFLRMIKADVGVQAGVRIKGSAGREAHSGEEALPDIRHACDLCLDVTVESFVDLNAELSLFTATLAKESWPLGSKTLLEGYLSLENDAESVHHGQIAMGWGECPNRQYLVTARVEDPDSPEEAKHAAIYWLEEIGVERTLVAEGDSPLTVYLYPGDYVLEGDHSGRKETQDFRVVDQPLGVVMDFQMIPLDEEYFPDAYFREAAAYCDRDGDGFLSSEERSQVFSFYLWHDELTEDPAWREGDMYLEPTSLDSIRYFRSLKNLEITGFGISELDLSRNTELRSLALCYDTRLTSIDVSHNTRLTWFTLLNAPVSQVDVSHNTMLQGLCLCALPLSGDTPVDVTANTALKELEIVNIRVPSIDLSPCTALEQLLINWNDYYPYQPAGYSLPTLDLSHNRALQWIQLSHCAFGSLDLSGYPALMDLEISDSQLTSLNLSGCPNLTWVSVRNSLLTSLNLSGKRSLVEVIAENCPNLTTVDVAGCPSLKWISVAHSPVSGLSLRSADEQLWHIDIQGSAISGLDLRFHAYPYDIEVLMDRSQKVYYKEGWTQYYPPAEDFDGGFWYEDYD